MYLAITIILNYSFNKIYVKYSREIFDRNIRHKYSTEIFGRKIRHKHISRNNEISGISNVLTHNISLPIYYNSFLNKIGKLSIVFTLIPENGCTSCLYL